ncbi:MAG: efflux RND transporter periplasmic adaptor subunit [Micropepsaceae bacterium]
MNGPKLLALTLLSCVALSLTACGKKEAATDVSKEQAIEAVVVTTTKVTRADVSTPILATGSLTPSRQTDIGPSVDGIIQQVWVGVGSRVNKGDPLFQTRDVDTRLQIRELESQVALARAQQTNARNEYTRQTSLKTGGWVSQSRMDTTKTGAAVAAAQLGVWEAKLAQARQLLSDTIVRAPYRGVISRKDVYEGRFMATRFGGMPGGASGVVQIMDIDPLAAIVVAPSTYFGQLKLGMIGRIYIDGVEKPVEAKVAVINYGVDYKSRGVEVRLSVPNPGYKILPGLYTKVELIPDARPALVADRRSILGSEGGRFAFINDNGKAKKIKLSTRELDGERMEILSNVPEGTELLAGPNLPQLVDGIPIKFEKPPAADKAPTQAQL